VRRFAVLLLAAALLVPAARAGADADPASDVLLGQDVFTPYQPNTVSGPLSQALTETVARAHRAGFPLKVALIATPTDLGAIPNLFGHPGQYAAFVDSEISFNERVPVLVLMPQGAGTAAAPRAPRVALGSGPVGDALARAAIPAVAQLSAAAGHPIVAPAIPTGNGGSGGGGPSPLITFGGPVLLVAAFALSVALVRRRQA
jgi:hypothetical protein